MHTKYSQSWHDLHVAAGKRVWDWRDALPLVVLAVLLVIAIAK